MPYISSTNLRKQRFILAISQNDIRPCLENTLLEILLALQRVTLVVRTLHHTVLVRIAHTIIIGRIFTAAFHRQVIVLHQSRVEHQALPVIIRLGSQIRCHFERAHSSRLPGNGRHFRPSGSIQQIQIFGWRADTDIGRKVDNRFPLGIASLLRRHDDDTVGCTRTVDSCRRSVFQHVDTGNIVRVDVVDSTHIHTVHDIQRRRVIQSSDTTDHDTCTSSRSATL